MRGVHVAVKVVGRSLCLIQIYGPNTSALYPEFMKKISDSLRGVKTSDSTILLGDFNAHVGNDAAMWKGVIGRRGNANVNDNGRLLLQLCRNNAPCIMSTFCSTSTEMGTGLSDVDIVWVNGHSLISA